MSKTSWKIDPNHTSVEFAVAHMHVSTFRSRFGEVAGEVVLDLEDPASSSIEARVAVQSLQIREKGFYDKLMGPDFFAAEAHPQMTFRSTKVARLDDTRWRAEGELTLRGVAKPLTLEIEAQGGGNNPFARVPMQAFLATGTLDRAEWGMKWNVPLDIGKPYLGEQVQLRLQVELLKTA